MPGCVASGKGFDPQKPSEMNVMPKSSTTKSAKKRVNIKDMPAKEKKMSKKDMKKVKGGITTELGMPAPQAATKDASKLIVK